MSTPFHPQNFSTKWLIWPLVLIGILPAWGATETVTSTQDDGPGSLRQALNTAGPGDTIQFSVTGTITLATALPNIGNDLTIIGPGAAQLAISGNGAVQVFWINPGTVVSMSGLTIKNAYDTEGAISNFWHLNTEQHVFVRQRGKCIRRLHFE